MNQSKPSERGQALVLIAFALIGLIGMTALAIDGGNFFSDRRHAQNAADAAALAAGLTYLRTNDFDAAEADAMTRAESNGYANTDEFPETVRVITPPESGSYIDEPGYMQVIITSRVKTYLAPIVGITQLTNRVDAVVYVDPTTVSPLLPGNAILSLSEHACPAVKIQGSSKTTLIDGGLFVNSDATDCKNNPDPLFSQAGGAGLVAPGLCTVVPTGAEEKESFVIEDALGNDTFQTDCKQVNPTTAFIEPNIICDGDVTVDPDDPNRLLPGNFPGETWKANTFPPAKNEDTNKAFENLELAPGVYCIDGNFTINSTDYLRGSNVVFAITTGGVTINGGADLDLSAPEVTRDASGKRIEDPNNPYAGLLFFMPSSNLNTIQINGGANVNFTGTILAPGDTKAAGSPKVTINGSADTQGKMISQVITSTIELNGGASTIITYDPENSWHPGKNPQVELIE